ncbi:MAG: signal peptidase II [Acidimicrobiales bacterium]
MPDQPASDDPTPVDAAAPPAGDGRRRIGLVLAVAAAVIVVDQLTKWWAVETLSSRTIDVVWKLRLILVENRGSSFSLTQSGGPVLSLLALGVVGGLLWYSRGVRSRWALVALGLIAGGAVGNLIDRALRGDAGFMQGAVIDFIDVQFWPVLNVADMGISIGAVLLVVVLAFSPGDGAEADG